MPASEGLAQVVAACEDNCTGYGEAFPGEACCRAFDVRFDGTELVCRMYSEYYLTASTALPDLVQPPTVPPTSDPTLSPITSSTISPTASPEAGCRVCYTRDDSDECATIAPTAAPTLEGAGIERARRVGAHGASGPIEEAVKPRDRRDIPKVVDYSQYELPDQADYRTRRQLVIPIKFSDQDDVTSIEDLKTIFNSRGGGKVGSDTVTGIRTEFLSPAGSVRDFWLENSYHKADTISTVIPEWVPLSEGAAFYGGGDAGKGDVGGNRICFGMAEGLAYVRKNYPNLRWADFVHHTVDTVGNRAAESDFIHEVLFIQSGYPAEFGSDGADRIWSHKYVYGTNNCGTVRVNSDLSVVNSGATGQKFTDWIKSELGTNPATGNLIQIKGYLITNGCFGDGGSFFSNGCELPRLGVIAHEMGHGSLFGLSIKDYYEVAHVSRVNMWPSHCSSTGSVGNGIGTFGLMGDSWGMCGDQFWPPQLSSWSKVQLGWINPITPPANGAAARYALYPSEQCPDVIEISRNFPADERLFVENKAAVGVDSTTDRSGIAVIHVDNAAGNSNQKPAWTATGDHQHYRVRVEQTDGSDELECGINKGSGSDLLGGVGSTIGDYTTDARFSTAKYSDSPIPISTHNVITSAGVESQSGEFGSGSVVTVDITTSDNGGVPITTFTDGYSTTCVAGQYSDRTGTCKSCPIGKYNPQGASATSVACNSACQVCPDGKYSDAPGASVCIACPAGKYDAIVHYPNNMASCWDCATRATDWGGNAGLDPISHETDTYCSSGSYSNTHREWESLILKNSGECETPTYWGLTAEEWIIAIVCTVLSVMLLGVGIPKLRHKIKERKAKIAHEEEHGKLPKNAKPMWLTKKQKAVAAVLRLFHAEKETEPDKAEKDKDGVAQKGAAAVAPGVGPRKAGGKQDGDDDSATAVTEPAGTPSAPTAAGTAAGTKRRPGHARPGHARPGHSKPTQQGRSSKGAVLLSTAHDDGANDPDGLSSRDRTKLADAKAAGMIGEDHALFKHELQQEAANRRRKAKNARQTSAAGAKATQAKKPPKPRPRPRRPPAAQRIDPDHPEAAVPQSPRRQEYVSRASGEYDVAGGFD